MQSACLLDHVNDVNASTLRPSPLCAGYGNNLHFSNNTCILLSDSHGGYASDCELAFNQTCSHNQVANPSGVLYVCKEHIDLRKWLSEGHDPGTTVSTWPSNDAIIAQAKAILGM